MHKDDIASRVSSYRQKNSVKSSSAFSAPAVISKMSGAPGALIQNAIQNTPQMPGNAFDAMIKESRGRHVPIAQILDPGELFAGKSLAFNRYAMDFINNGAYGNPNPYTDGQLLSAYMSSVYLFAALRRVSNLISRIKIVAEIKQGNKYVRAPETAMINRIFEKDGARVFSRMYLNYAIYGGAIAYKVKTLKAALEFANGNPIYDYRDNAIGGLHVLDRPMWELDEDTYTSVIRGVYVQRGSADIGNRNYLDRREFVYLTDWNPENPNKGRSIATVAIHEATTNAAIARWSAEYFTRGAMPFVLVSMEEDPAMIADTDLMKYKRQFEEHWQGVNSSLRSVFIDRKVEVQQVGIPAGEVAADDLNKNALEGISAAVGLDRELIVTPEGGSQERHAVLVKRAWEDTVIPTAKAMLQAFSEDMGLPTDIRLVLDLSHISELDADRDEKVQTEMAVYNDGMQTYNETRQRLNMPTISDLDGFIKTEDGLMPISSAVRVGHLAPPKIQETYSNWYDKGLATFNDYRVAMGMKAVHGLEDTVMVDGKLMKVARLIEMLEWPNSDQVQMQSDLYDKGLRTFNEVRQEIGLAPLVGFDDVFFMDGKPVKLESMLKLLSSPSSDQVSVEMQLFDAGVQSINEIRHTVGLKPIEELEDWFIHDGKLTTLQQMVRKDKILDPDLVEQIVNLWSEDLMPRSKVAAILGIEFDPKTQPDGYKTGLTNMMQFDYETRGKKVDMAIELYKDRRSKEMELEFDIKTKQAEADWDKKQEELQKAAEAAEAAANGGSLPSGQKPGGDDDSSGWRSFNPSWEDPEDDDPDDPTPTNPFGPGGNGPGGSSGSGGNSGSKGSNKPNGFVGGNGSGAELYISPSQSSLIVDYLPSDDALFINGRDDHGEWLRVATMDKDNGWVKRSVVNTDIRISDLPVLHNDVSVTKELNLENTINASIDTDDGLYKTDIEAIYGVAGEINTKEPHYEISDNSSREASLTPIIMRSPKDFNLTESDIITMAENILDKIQNDLIRKQEKDVVDVEKNSQLTDNRELYISKPISDNLSFEASGQNKAYAALWLANDPEIIKATNEIRRELSDVDGIDWVDPSIYHVTLLYVNEVDDAAMSAAQTLLPKQIKTSMLKCGPLMYFENEYDTVICFAVSLDQELSQLQQRFNATFNAYGSSMSQYSDPAKYTPHITIGYAKPGVRLPDMDRFFEAKPLGVYLMRDDYEIKHKIPVVITKEDTDNLQPAGNIQQIISEVVQNPEQDNEQIKSALRDKWKARLKQWQDNGAPVDALPDKVVDAVRTYSSKIKSGIIPDEIFEGIGKAIDAKLFDSDAMPDKKILDQYVGYNSSKAIQSTASEELKAWERKTLRGGLKKGLSFESSVLPQAVRATVRQALRDLGTSNSSDENIKSLFVSAKNILDQIEAGN